MSKKYTGLVFAQGEGFAEFETALNGGGEQALFEVLLEHAPDINSWEYYDKRDKSPAGETDHIFEREYRGRKFEVAYNLKYGYAGLCLMTEDGTHLNYNPNF